MAQQNFPAKNLYGIAVYSAFCVLILGAIISLRPGWGFMDDHTNLRIAREFWQDPSWQSLLGLITGDAGIGRFQPLYKLWIISAYKFGADAPWLLYFLTTLAGLLVLPLWGMILDKIFNEGRRSPFWIWVYPLAFFIFIPFWNAFMYISIQEKFLYLFSAPAVFFFVRAYEETRWGDLGRAFLFCFLAVMSKETGIVLFLAFAAYAFFDATLFRRQRSLSWAAWAGNTAFFILYYFFIQHLMSNYTAKYARNLSLSSLGDNFLTAPFYIKILAGLNLSILLWYFIRKFWDNKFEENGRTLFAWLSLLYIFILLPWGFPTYLLPPLAVFAVSAAAPVFQAAERWPSGRWAPRAALVSLAYLIALFVIVPQIEKMADKRMVVHEINQLRSKAAGAEFFYPAPYPETAAALRAFSGARINYLSDSKLSAGLLTAPGPHYLLMNDECHPAALSDTAILKNIYRSSTWNIYEIGPKPGHQSYFKEYPAKNAFQNIVALIKKL